MSNCELWLLIASYAVIAYLAINLLLMHFFVDGRTRKWRRVEWFFFGLALAAIMFYRILVKDDPDAEEMMK